MIDAPALNATDPASLRTGPALVRATKVFAQEKRVLSWWYVLSTGGLLAGAYAATLLDVDPFLRLAASGLAGLLTLRFFVLYHDQQHHAILAGSRIAEGMMRVFGLFVLSPSSVWRSSHNHHHKHNSKLLGSHIGSFPVMTKDQFERSSPRERAVYLWIRHPLTIGLGYVTMFFVGMCLMPFLTHPRRHVDGLLSILLHAGVAVLLASTLNWTAVLFFQTLPLLLACAIGSYLFYAQHNFPGVTFTENAGWAYEKAALDSSSFMRTGPVMAWFSANIGFHHIHHLNHRIPFYRLPEAFAALPELRAARTTSLAPREILRCLRLKVWDVETGRMVGLKELRAPANALGAPDTRAI
jgi:omega-6 fatty acid desaturase (delta-12 desaturase)